MVNNEINYKNDKMNERGIMTGISDCEMESC